MAAKAVVFAYHDVGVRCLGALLEAGVEVPLVVTHRDDPAENVWFASVAALARDRGIEVAFPDVPFPREMFEKIKHVEPDFIFSFYYRRLLPMPLLALAGRGAFNMHGSLLPKYRGRAPVNWAVIRGETETGATLHEMAEKADAGRIVGQQAVPIGPDELAVEVFRKVTDAAARVLTKSLPSILEGNVSLKTNDLSAGSYFGGRKPEDGRIDWSKSAAEIHNLVRGVAPPYPGAFCDFEGKVLKIFRTRKENQENQKQFPEHRAGPVRVAADWFAVCGDGKVLRLLETELT